MGSLCRAGRAPCQEQSPLVSSAGQHAAIHAFRKNCCYRKVAATVSDLEPAGSEARARARAHTHTQVLITPHVSAVSYANDVAGLFTQNLKLYLDGPCSDAPKDAEAHARGPSAEAAADLRDRMLYVVDWEQGY